MRPTWPLLLMTGLQGLAGGLFATLAWMGLAWGGRAVPLAVWADLSRVGLVLVAAGGVASIFHMHRLAGARFVLRRLATSWLSREVVTTAAFGLGAAVVVGLPLVHAVGSGWYVGGDVVVGVLGLTAMYTTAMIYASIPAMLSWHSPLTVLAMMGTGLLSGSLWVKMGWDLASAGAPSARGLDDAIWLGMAMWTVVKVLQLRLFHEARARLRAETGLGLALQPHRLLDTGTTRPPYRTQPQVWIGAGYRLRAAMLASLALAVACIVPLTAIEAGWAGLAGAVAAAWSVYADRWLFFADATHSSRVFFPNAGPLDARMRSSRTGLES